MDSRIKLLIFDNHLNLIMINVNDRLIIALDVKNFEEAKKIVNNLGDLIIFYKIGLELFASKEYFKLIEWLKNKGKKIFCDLKLLDIPNTVGNTVKNVSSYEIDFLTIHISSQQIMHKAIENKGNSKIIGVTILTSMNQQDINDMGYDKKLKSLVIHKAKLATESGLDGIVTSGHEINLVKNVISDDMIIITPGIRLLDDSKNDQNRVIDPLNAFKNGSDYIVVGRSISNSLDPYNESKKFLQIIEKYFLSKDKNNIEK